MFVSCQAGSGFAAGSLCVGDCAWTAAAAATAIAARTPTRVRFIFAPNGSSRDRVNRSTKPRPLHSGPRSQGFYAILSNRKSEKSGRSSNSSDAR